MQAASLFLETAFSFNGSNILIEPLIEKAKHAKYESLVLTDKKMHAVYQFYHLCKAAGITPVIGLQIYLEPVLNGSFIHVAGYARNTEGYKNLLKISSLQSYNDTIPFSLIKEYCADVSFVLLLHDGELHQNLTSETGFTAIVHEISRVSSHLYMAEHEAFPCEYAPKVPRVAFDYVRYVDADDADVCKGLKSVLNRPQETTLDRVDSAFKPLSFFQSLDKNRQDMLDQFIKRHSFDLIKASPSLPKYMNKHDLSSEAYLEALSVKGLEKRLKGKDVDHKPYEVRLKYELETIHKLGYDDYFLIVWDVIRWARNEDILVGPGRGSAPGSLVSYSLGITHVDPLAFNLLFERFLNDARATMPDIDIDFPDHTRDRVIAYTKERFGKEYVSHICTFGTFLKKSALRETARLFQIEKKHIEEMSRKIDKYDTVADMMNTNPDVKNRIEQNTDIAAWLAMAARIEGLPKHVSTHAAGIIISDAPIIEYTAIQEGLPGHHQTQYGQEDLESIGLLKMDFLGLRNLSMIEDILKYIEEDSGKIINMYQLPLDDKPTFKLLRERSSTGLFQLESQGMRQLIRDMQIESFDDIVTILALFRPGPMQSLDTYLKRRHRQIDITDLAEEIKEILAPTEGILLYQEQIMAIAAEFAGYAMNEADLLRRAVSKKSETALLAERERFVDKSMKMGRNASRANKIYDYIVTFANYGFNKSHSVAYAMISYWMAYLKTHYPAYFIAVLMQSALGNESLMKEYIQEALQLGIEVKPPDVAISGRRFVLNKEGLYFPLTGIRNIGKSVADQLETLRSETTFDSFVDFVAKTNTFINKRGYQYLIYAGACDGFSLNRHTMLENLESVQHFIGYQGPIGLDEFVFSEKEELEIALLKRYEHEALGFNIAFDPLKPYTKIIQDHHYRIPSQMHTLPIDNTLRLVGYVARVKEITTKTKESMAFLTLEDRKATVDAVCFPKAYKQYASVIEENRVMAFEGKVQLKNNNRQFIIERAKILKQ